MKRILNFTYVGLVAIAAMFLYSCEEDPTGPINVKPVVTLTSSSDITVAPEEVFTIEFSASKGDDSPLKTVTVYEDGTKVPTSRMTYNGAASGANPALLFGTDVDGLTWSIDIVAQSSAATTVTYEVEVADEAGQTRSVLVNVTTVGTPPSFTTTSPTVFMADQDIKNVIRLTAVKGSGNLVSIEVKENNQFVDPSKIFWQVISMSVADNPFTLAEAEQGGFENQELYIMTPASEGNFIYTVLLTDEFGLTAELMFDLTTNPAGTAVDVRNDVLLNADGPGEAGGLDLDTGNSTFPSDDLAEIIDNGIDSDLTADKNWLQSISPNSAQGVSMRYLVAGQNGLSETFTFGESVLFKEDLAALFDNGIVLDNNATGAVEVGDVFIVSRDGIFWVLDVTAINIVETDNTDSYMFDVKY